MQVGGRPPIASPVIAALGQATAKHTATELEQDMPLAQPADQGHLPDCSSSTLRHARLYVHQEQAFRARNLTLQAP